MFQVLLIITVFLVLLQVVLALGSVWERRNLERRFAYPLGSRMSNADLLETYSRVVRPINIKVNARIRQAAAIYRDLLLVNQRHVYRRDLYVTCYTIWLIKFTEDQNRDVKQKYRLLGILFGAELILLLLGVYAGSELFMLGAAVIGVLLLAFSYYMQIRYARILDEYNDIARDILNLDQVEAVRAEMLGEKLKTETFAYPFLPVIWTIRFITPF